MSDDQANELISPNTSDAEIRDLELLTRRPAIAAELEECPALLELLRQKIGQRFDLASLDDATLAGIGLDALGDLARSARKSVLTGRAEEANYVAAAGELIGLTDEKALQQRLSQLGKTQEYETACIKPEHESRKGMRQLRAGVWLYPPRFSQKTTERRELDILKTLRKHLHGYIEKGDLIPVLRAVPSGAYVELIKEDPAWHSITEKPTGGFRLEKLRFNDFILKAFDDLLREAKDEAAARNLLVRMGLTGGGYPPESDESIRWFEHFKQYYQMWMNVSAFRASLSTAIWERSNRNYDHYVNMAIYKFNALHAALYIFLLRFGHLWTVGDMEVEQEMMDSIYGMYEHSPFDTEDPTWLRHLLASPRSEEFAERPSPLEISRAMPSTPLTSEVKEQWQQFFASCRCEDDANKTVECRVHVVIQLCNRYCEMVESVLIAASNFERRPPDKRPTHHDVKSRLRVTLRGSW